MATASVKNAAIWSLIEALSNAVLSILSIIYLARILHPSDFGMVVTAQIIGTLVTLILSCGIVEAYIQRPKVSNILRSTLLVTSLILSSLSFIIFSILIFIFYGLLDEILLSKILFFEMLNSIFVILSILPTAILSRNLLMSSFTKRTLISRLLFFIVAIPCAQSGMGLWSIVYAGFAQSFFSFIFIFLAIRKMLPPRLLFKPILCKQLISFGFFIMLEDILWNVTSRIFSLLISYFHGSYALGIYNMSTRITDAITNILNTIIGRLALPLFSRYQNDSDRLYQNFKKSTLIFNSLSMPIFVGIAFTCDESIPLLLGKDWESSIPILQVICFMNAVMFSRIFVSTVIKSVGESRKFLYLSFSSASLAMFSVVLTRNYNLLITMYTWTSVRILITIFLGYILMKKILGFSSTMQFSPLVIPIISTTAMTLLAFNYDVLFSGMFSQSGLYHLIFKITILAVFYLITFYTLSKKYKVLP